MREHKMKIDPTLERMHFLISGLAAAAGRGKPCHYSFNARRF